MGTVVDTDGRAADGARVRVTNRATGHTVETIVRHGRFAVAGLDVGGEYAITVRQLGYQPHTREGLSLSLGERLEVDVELAPGRRPLDTVRTTASEHTPRASSRTGVGLTIPDSSLRRLPSRNRDLYDFVQLVPQVTARSGISGGGVNFRYNSLLLDGVSERALQGGLPAGGQSGGKSVSIDAVKEYQVLLSPYEVRYGDFAGALVNAVSKAGTNDLRGSAYAYVRSDKLARSTAFLRDAPYRRVQYGLTLGGPIVRDRVHFFIAPELQHLVGPAPGPYVGQAASNSPPVAPEDVSRFVAILRQRGLEAGSAERIDVRNPLLNHFTRVDVLVPEWRSRLVLRHNYDRVRADRFTRALPGAVFPLSSYGWTQHITKSAVAAQLTTHVGRGANELRIGYTTLPQSGVSSVRQPVIVVSVPSADGAGVSSLQAGTNELAQGQELEQTSAEIHDDFSLLIGPRHVVSLGVHADVFRLQVRGAISGSYGRWEFSNLDLLEQGMAARYSLARDRGGADAPLRGTQFALYGGDEWRVADRVVLTYGLRADVLALRGHPPYNAHIDTTYGRRTDAVPAARVQWSPRIAFTWDVGSKHADRIRGGAGMFAGRPPLSWLHGAFREYGAGTAHLSCGNRRSDLGAAPPFVADVTLQPTACANNVGFTDTTRGAVTLLASRLGLAKTLRTSLAYDWTLPANVAATVEALYTRHVADFLFVNSNLAGPVGADSRGRILYGAIAPNGQATPHLVDDVSSDVIDVRPQSRNYAYQLSTRIAKRFGGRLDLTAAYAFSRVRDVQSSMNAFPSGANWRNGRVMSARHESVVLGVSAFEVPHRVVLTAVYNSPWRRWATDLSLYYVGESGSPFTYLAFGASGLGDLNADGTNANDPIYVPRSAFDDREIRFSGQSSVAGADSSPAARSQRMLEQQDAFERFVEESPCLRGQRGAIVRRNSCRAPRVHTTSLAIRQSLPLRAGHAFVLQLEVFNLLNLLDATWGRVRIPNASVLEHVGHVATGAGTEPVFRFDRTRPRFDWQNVESGYQLQIAARYSF